MKSIDLFKKVIREKNIKNRPVITISYAQSVDGSIAARNKQRIHLSGRESTRFTHALRAEHDAILVGINTVLIDNPRLTVRYCSGINPQPIVMDTNLRIPLDSYLIKDHPLRPWIATSRNVNPKLENALKKYKVDLMSVETTDNNKIEIHDLLNSLKNKGINTIMVEGGAQIISSFLNAQLVDYMFITISPMYVGGMRILQNENENVVPELDGTHCRYLGKDLLFQGIPSWR